MPFVKCSDINVYYEIHGDGIPLLFLNGLSSDIPQRTKFINAAKKSFKIVIPDIRGAGLTDKPQGTYSIGQFARDAHELLGKLCCRRINVMGFSMGGNIAATIAIDYPDIVDRLVLISTKPAWMQPAGLSDEANRIFHSTEISEALLIDLFNLIYGPDYKKRVPVKSYVRARMTDPNPQPIHAYLNQLQACEKFDLCAEIKNIRKPTLIITGKDDRLISPANSHWLHDSIAGSKLIEYDGVGHMTVDECPERLVRDVLSFLS